MYVYIYIYINIHIHILTGHFNIQHSWYIQKSLKSPFFHILMLGLNFSKSRWQCIELLPCDWLISNLCYQPIEQVYLIKWPVSVYIYILELECSIFLHKYDPKHHQIFICPESRQREPNQTSETFFFVVIYLLTKMIKYYISVHCKSMWIFAFSIWCDPLLLQ